MLSQPQVCSDMPRLRQVRQNSAREAPPARARAGRQRVAARAREVREKGTAVVFGSSESLSAPEERRCYSGRVCLPGEGNAGSSPLGRSSHCRRKGESKRYIYAR